MSTVRSRPPVVSAAEAVSRIPSGARIFVGSGCAAPQALIQALVARAPSLHDVELVHLMTLGMADYVKEEYRGHFRHNAFFIGPNVRAAVREGRADYTPIFLSELPDLIRSGQCPTDVALIQVSPPDRHGVCTLGIHVDIQPAVLQSARIVIAQVNPNMPRTWGNTAVPLSAIDYLVESEEPLLELQPPELDDITLRIGAHVASLVDDGSTLQLGIGKIPDAVLRMLTDKRWLGIHTEMFSDGALALLEAGVIDNSRKGFHDGKTLTSFTMGTRRLYDFVDENPLVEYHPSDYANHPVNIARNAKMVAVNSALQVDLTGQVCADSLGYNFYSGIGGQVDFIRGAAMSQGGKPIIALPSTAAGGQVSRIVSHLDEGAGVVTSRGDVHYVVTEWGIAYLHGKSIRERALELIQVAHPDFRNDLLDFVRSKHYVRADEKAWAQISNPYPFEMEEKIERRGQILRVRPLRATDERSLQEFFYSHDPDTVYERYFYRKKELGQAEAATLCCVDYQRRMALGIWTTEGPPRLVGVARYDLDPAAGDAETAVVIGEAWRRQGLASHLLGRLEEYAKEHKIQGFRSEVLVTNGPMIQYHRARGHSMRLRRDRRSYVVRNRFPSGGEDATSGDSG